MVKISHVKNKKKTTKIIFVQDWYIWNSETLVIVGGTLTDGLAYSKKIRAKKSFTNWIEEIIKDDKEIDTLGRQLGRAYYHNDTGATILLLKGFSNDWAWFETLLHEIVHLVDDVLGKAKAVTNEYEARAYTTEFLFREIRNKVSRTKT